MLKLNMKLFRQLCYSLLIFMLVFTLIIPIKINNVYADIPTFVYFSEDFENLEVKDGTSPQDKRVFPSGWKLVDVDGLTPVHEPFVDDAWVVVDILDDPNHAMVSFSDGGTADDWAWTPLLENLPGLATLIWRALATDPNHLDGYEVRIMEAPNEPTGSQGNLGNMVTHSIILFSIDEENGDTLDPNWGIHDVDLSDYAGKSVYIAFRNQSTDKYLLLVDDIKITYVKPTPDAPDPPELESKTQTSITLVSISGVEYSQNYDGPWQDSPTFTGLTPGQSYNFWARIKETEYANASERSSATSIQTEKAKAPTPNAPELESKTDTSVTLVAVSGALYNKDGANQW